MTIKVKRGKLRAKYAEVTRHGNGKYTIVLNEKNTPFENAVALYHEFLHIVFWEYLPFEQEDREHKMITACEKSFKRHLKKYWFGGAK